jgi:polyhydroxyalkanoate synthesis regulator phasin
MLFSNFVATIRADLDAIRDDLGEFVETVKTDTTAMLGLEQNQTGGGSGNGGSSQKYLQWEEELWDNPELLCEDPESADWEEFCENSLVKEEEVEALLSGGASEIVPELYRELVPSRSTHADFFKRLIYHRNRLNQVVRTRMDELVAGGIGSGQDDEEETRWEDDSVSDEQPTTGVITAATSTKTQQVADEASLALKAENDSLKQELQRCRREMEALAQRVAELESSLKQSVASRVELESKLSSAVLAVHELPHKKAALPPAEKTTEEAEEIAAPVQTATPPTTTSWEALPISPQSSTGSSSEEPVVVLSTKQEEEEEEEEEDDWE